MLLFMIMFVADRSWVKENLDGLMKQWGYFPELDHSEILHHLGEYTYNLRAAQRIIEQHLWGGEVKADVVVKFLDMDLPGRIELIQTWKSGIIYLDMTIEVSNVYREFPEAQMAILAHEYSHAFHYLRDDFHPPIDSLEYENLTDLSTVALGMGQMMLRGREVKRNPSTKDILGYMDGDLLAHAQKIYESKEGKYPPADSMPHATIRPGSETSWKHEEPIFTVPVTPPKPKKKTTEWDEERLRCILDSGEVLPFSNDTTIGRSFAKSHLNPKEKNKISRDQLNLRLSKKKLRIENIGKNPVELRYNQKISFLGIELLTYKTKVQLVKGQHRTVPKPSVEIYLPSCHKFVLK